MLVSLIGTHFVSAPLFTRPATSRSPHRFPPRAAVSVTLARPALCCSACSPAHIRNPSPSGGAPSRRVRSGCCVAVVAGSSQVAIPLPRNVKHVASLSTPAGGTLWLVLLLSARTGSSNFTSTSTSRFVFRYAARTVHRLDLPSA